MKSYYVIAFYSGAKGTKYIDNSDSQFGCCDSENAKPFDTKEDAQAYIDSHGYIAWVETVEPFECDNND